MGHFRLTSDLQGTPPWKERTERVTGPDGTARRLRVVPSGRSRQLSPRVQPRQRLLQPLAQSIEINCPTSGRDKRDFVFWVVEAFFTLSFSVFFLFSFFSFFTASTTLLNLRTHRNGLAKTNTYSPVRSFIRRRAYARYIYELIYVSIGLSTKYSDDA